MFKVLFSALTIIAILFCATYTANADDTPTNSDSPCLKIKQATLNMEGVYELSPENLEKTGVMGDIMLPKTDKIVDFSTIETAMEPTTIAEVSLLSTNN
jgi:hypothetical protein